MKVLVIGAGPGGLASAINLAGQGFEVTVVEKEPIPGGRMRGLTMGDYQVDTGPTILQLPQVLQSVFQRAGKRLEDYATLVRLEPNTRIHFWDGTHLDTSADPARMKAQLARLDPTLPAAFDAWLAESKVKYPIAYEKFICTRADSLGYYAPWRLLDTLRFRPWQSLYKHLDSFFHDDRVTYAFSYPSKYLGLHPTTCSSVFSVIPYLEVEFGVWHVKGGFRALAQGMARCAQDLGATFRYQAPVTQVLVENGRATGVVLESGEKLTADAVVINADLPWAATRLIAPQVRAGTRLSDSALEKAHYSCSTFMLYLGLDARYDGLPHHLIHLSEAVRRTDAAALEDHQVDLEDPPFYVCNPTPTDPSGVPAGHSSLYVLVPTPNTGREVDWKQTEQTLIEKIPGWLEKVGLHGVKPHIRAQRAFTAQTWRDDFNVFRGAVFNLSHNWTQLGPLRPKVKSPHVSGLYWVGGGTHPGSGLLTILESANIAADYLTAAAGQGRLPHWPFTPRAA
ncbi:MAG: phytoene desaturase family protein [Myxococcota bacterium]|nr:phytoene desaturase family protein [Myxococcota bacterium]